MPAHTSVNIILGQGLKSLFSRKAIYLLYTSNTFLSLLKTVLSLLFRVVLGSHQNGEDDRVIPFPPAGTASPSRVVDSLQLMGLHRHMVITQIPEFTLGFTLVHYVDLEEYIRTHVHH